MNPRTELVWLTIREWNSHVTRYWEKYRQRLLIHQLGQVTCWDNDRMHREENLPCQECGAAL